MNKLNYTWIFILLLTLTYGCNKEANPQSASSEWLIPSGEVQDGGPGKDGIPSIDQPQFNTSEAVDFPSENDLIVGMVNDGIAKAYPHPILDWHEIVNDNIGDKAVALTYCPLTGTAIAWNRTINGETTTFGVSGKLYNSNLIPYDRATDSYWSQAKLECVNGEEIGAVSYTHLTLPTKA